MNATFKLYEEEYNKSVDNLRKVIDQITLFQADERSLRELNFEMDEAEKALKQMELELLTLPTSVKYSSTSKVKRLKTDFEDLKRKAIEIKSSTAVREKNINSDENEYYNKQDERFLKNQQVLSNGVEKLKNVKKTAYEADEIGKNTVIELKSQTEKLEKAIIKGQDIRSELNWSEKLISEMNRRRITNKILLSCMIVCIAICLIGVLVLNYYY